MSSSKLIASISNSISRIIQETDDGYSTSDSNGNSEDTYRTYAEIAGDQLSKTILIMVLFFMFVLIGYNTYNLLCGPDSEEQNNDQVEVVNIKKEAEIV